ncbi:MAG: rane protein [Acidimicrobiales bacterium]|nr:rane protein [Acidimicrobiales bacterium]
MLAVLGGLGAALAWAVATLCSARASRAIGATATLAWVMVVGLVVITPALALSHLPTRLDASAIGWLALAGVGNVGGLLFVYAGLRVGKVGVVAPVASTEGVIAALLSVATGERLGLPTFGALAVIGAGIVLAGVGQDVDVDEPREWEGRGGREGRESRGVLLGAAAAVAFGCSLYATGKVGHRVPVVWAVLPPRLVGVAVVALPMALARRLPRPGPSAPLLLGAGVCEVVGFVSFTLGARHGIAVSAVLASQFAAFAGVAAYVLFRERLTPVQLTGVVTIVVGVAALSGLRA